MGKYSKLDNKRKKQRSYMIKEGSISEVNRAIKAEEEYKYYSTNNEFKNMVKEYYEKGLSAARIYITLHDKVKYNPKNLIEKITGEKIEINDNRIEYTKKKNDNMSKKSFEEQNEDR